MSKLPHIPKLDAHRIAIVAESERATGSARATRPRRRKRAAAAALGALALTSGVTGALDIVSRPTASANGSNLGVGRLSITLTSHGGFKLDTCSSDSHQSSTSDEGDNRGATNNDANYTETVFSGGRTLTIEYESEEDYYTHFLPVESSNNNANNQTGETVSRPNIPGINSPNESLSDWAGDDGANPFILEYGLNENEDAGVELSRLNAMTAEEKQEQQTRVFDIIQEAFERYDY